jgi:hypothetical protein
MTLGGVEAGVGERVGRRLGERLKADSNMRTLVVNRGR